MRARIVPADDEDDYSGDLIINISGLILFSGSFGDWGKQRFENTWYKEGDILTGKNENRYMIVDTSNYSNYGVKEEAWRLVTKEEDVSATIKVCPAGYNIDNGDGTCSNGYEHKIDTSPTSQTETFTPETNKTPSYIFNRFKVKEALECDNNYIVDGENDSAWVPSKNNLSTNEFVEAYSSSDPMLDYLEKKIKEPNSNIFSYAEFDHHSNSLTSYEKNTERDCYKDICPEGYERVYTNNGASSTNRCSSDINRLEIKKFPKTLYIPYNENDVESKFKVPNLNEYFIKVVGTNDLEYSVDNIGNGLDVSILPKTITKPLLGCPTIESGYEIGYEIEYPIDNLDGTCSTTNETLKIESTANNSTIEEHFATGNSTYETSFDLIVSQDIESGHLEGGKLEMKFKINVVLLNSVYAPSSKKLYRCQALSDNQ